MRVIAGEFRSRLLKAVPGLEVRPTPDRLRETLFNILAPDVPGCVFLDAYAGSGSVGIEALSRGAKRTVFIEESREAAEIIEENIRTLGLKNRAIILRGAVQKIIDPDVAELLFLDPPYPLEGEYRPVLETLGESARVRIVVAQHSVRMELAVHYGALERYRQVRQGENALSFYRLDRAVPPG